MDTHDWRYTRIPLGLVVMIIVVVCLDLEVLLNTSHRGISRDG